MTPDQNKPTVEDLPGSIGRGALIAATVLLTVIAVFLCLIPKPENDLFFELRIGSDILHSGHVPHFDTYSWVNRGTRWDVPEWLAFVLYALAFRLGGFFGTWMVLVLLTVAAAWVVWFWLMRRVGLLWAFPLTTLMLLAMSDYLQERPYVYSYLLLAVSLAILRRAREDRPRLLLWLVPLCALWTNLHQGVLVLICLLLLFGLGDALTSVWRGWNLRSAPPDLLTADGRERALTAERDRRHDAASAGRMVGMAAACACAALFSPYGWRVYWNVLITLRDHTLMANVLEWKSVAVVPLGQLPPFLAVVVIAFGSLAISPRRSLADTLAVTALFGESLLHARGIPLFAIGSMVICAPHFESAVRQIRRLGYSRRPRRWLLAAFALAYAVTIALASVSHLRREIGTLGYSPEGIGEAAAEVPRYPADACAFMDAEGFPSNLRLLNNFEIGGYLMWRLPREPVFVDGRLDVYVGRTFDDMLILTRDGGSPAWAALVRRYDFDCVITTSARQAKSFAADPQWQLVYEDSPTRRPRCRILLRRRPEFAGLIARCLRDQPSLPL